MPAPSPLQPMLPGAGGAPATPDAGAAPGDDSGGQTITITDNGDGTYTVSQGDGDDDSDDQGSPSSPDADQSSSAGAAQPAGAAPVTVHSVRDVCKVVEQMLGGTANPAAAWSSEAATRGPSGYRGTAGAGGGLTM